MIIKLQMIWDTEEETLNVTRIDIKKPVSYPTLICRRSEALSILVKDILVYFQNPRKDKDYFGLNKIK